MTGWSNRPAVLAGVILLGGVAAACSSQKKSEPSARAAPVGGTSGSTAVGIQPGVAGGSFNDTTTVAVTVSAVDVASRRVTLVDEAGNKATFPVRPEIRNLDQVRAGDRLTATLKQQVVISARAGGGEPSNTYAAAVASAQKGAPPAGVIAASYESVATVTAIDPVEHAATHQFADGRTHTVAVRSDVDLSRYKVGDSVIIRVTSTLALLASRP